MMPGGWITRKEMVLTTMIVLSISTTIAWASFKFFYS